MNLKKLAYSVDDLKIILILQNEILLFMLFCKRVNKQREGIPKYGNTINNNYFFLGGGGGEYVLIFSAKLAYLEIF